MSGRGMLLLRNAILGATDNRYEGARDYAEMTITSVEKDSTGGTINGRGTIDGAGEDIVPMRGVTNTQVDDVILISYPKGNPSGQKRYEYHVRSANPAPQIIVDASLPDPAWATVPYTSAIVSSAGSVLANLVVYFNAVEDRFFPEGYTASFKIAGGEWRESGFAPHIGGAQQILLGNDFTPGTSVQVRLRAHYSRSAVMSPGLDTRTCLIASDNITPGSATGLTVDLNIPGGMKINPTGVLDIAHFDRWRYYIATSSGGAGLQTMDGPAGFVFASAPGNYYVAVAPVSHSGVVGTRYPAVAGTYTGPHAIAGYAPPLDTTPPLQWAAPTLAGNVNQPATGGEEYWLTVTLNTNANYTDAASPQTAVPDYAYTLVRIQGTGFYREETLVPGQTFVKLPVIAGIVLSVTVQGVDKLGNSGAASTAATITLTATGAPTGTPSVSCFSAGAGVYINWTVVTNALNYEVEYSTTNDGVADGVLTITDATMFVDLLYSQTEISPTHYYRVRAKNLQGNGPWSTWTPGTYGKVDGQNLRLASVTANEIVGDQAFFNKVTTGNLLATNIRTATSGARVEINGPSQMIEFFNATQRTVGIYTSGFELFRDGTNPRLWLEPSGLYIYQDTGAAVLRARFNGTGITIFADDGTTIVSEYSDNGFAVYNPSQSKAFFVSTNSDNGVQLVMSPLFDVQIGNTVNEVTINLNSTGGVKFLLSGGTRFTFQRLSDTILGIVPSTTNMVIDIRSAQLYAKSVLIDGGFLYVDSSGARSLSYNGSQYVMPGANLVLNGVTITSSRELKRDIQHAQIDLTKAHELRAKVFRWRDDPNGAPKRLGFVAEEVAEALPEVAQQARLSASGSEIASYSLDGIVAAQQEMIRDLRTRLIALEAR